MNDTTKAAEIAVLNLAAEAEPNSKDFDLLLSSLGLQSHRREFLAVLRAGYWRKAKCRSRFNFVKSKVLAAALCDPDHHPDALGDADTHEGAMEHHRALFGPNRVSISEDLLYGHNDERDPFEDYTPQGIDHVHRSLVDWVPVDPSEGKFFDQRLCVNWKRVGDGMGLDHQMVDVLEYIFVQNLSCRAASRLHCNRGRQMELKAAWARVERLLESGRLTAFLTNPKIPTEESVATSPVSEHI